MHDAQTKEAPVTQEQKEKRVRRQQPRPFMFYVVVNSFAADGERDTTILQFDNKAKLREVLGGPEYEKADIRIIRGYEMKTQTKRHISIN